MAKVQGTFWGESRVFGYPLIDMNGMQPFAPANPTKGSAPLQFTSEDGDVSWELYGHSAVYFTPAAGGVPSNSLVNLQINRQDNGMNLVRQGPQANPQGLAVNLGAPLQHVCGKAGNPAYMSYSLPMPGGTRLTALVSHQLAAAPTGRSPLAIVAHTYLRRAEMAKIQIGSKSKQQQVYRGVQAYFTGTINLSAASPLAINQGTDVIIPINTTQYFFIDSLWCRALKVNEPASPNVLLPNSDLNALTAEDEIYVSLKDTSNQAPFTLPGAVPLWSIFGSTGGRYYHPPTQFVVRPRGSLQIEIQNGPTTEITYGLEFTVGGVLVEKPSPAIMEQLN